MNITSRFTALLLATVSFVAIASPKEASAQTCTQYIQQAQAYVNYIRQYCGDPRIASQCEQMRAYIRAVNSACRVNLPVPSNPSSGGSGGGSTGGGSGGGSTGGGSGGGSTCSSYNVPYYTLSYTGPSSGTLAHFCCRNVAENYRASYAQANPRYRFTVTSYSYTTDCRSTNTVQCVNGQVQLTPYRGTLYTWRCN